MTEVNEWMMNEKDTIALIQELAQHKGKITNIDNAHIKSYTGVVNNVNNSHDTRPRACILVNSNVNIVKLTQFSDKDQVSVLIVDLYGRNTVFSSIYMPYDSREPPPSQLMQDLVEFCNQNNWNLIIGSDANSHNIMWGSSNDNARGEHLLEYIVGTNLEICNIGNTPTFVTAPRQEVIDITLASIDITGNIINWQVGDDMQSDHRPITFKVDGEYIHETEKYRNVRNTRWDLYNRELKRQVEVVELNNENLDDLTGLITNAIDKAYKKSCKEKARKSGKGKPDWWNEDLTRLKREAKAARKRYLDSPNQENRTSRTRSVNLYSRELKKAKNESWRNFCSRTEGISAVARLQKVMKNGKMADIGTVKKSDGTYTSSQEETLTELLDKLIPNQVNVNRTQISNFFTAENVKLTEETIGKIINDTTVRSAIKLFSPYKSPGIDGIYPILLQKGIDILVPYLVQIYRLSLRSGKLAKQWLNVKTVFIPKPGKTDYALAKSYRPISLMSFMVKTLERLIFWHVQDEHMVRHPINDNIYSYREGVSTETALHKVVYKIETALAHKEFAMAVFLDISGAFSNIATDGIIRTFASKGVEVEIVHWVNDLLSNRTATTQLGKAKVVRAVNGGIAEGSNASPPCLTTLDRRTWIQFRLGQRAT